MSAAVRRMLVRKPDGKGLLLQDDHVKAHQGVRGPAVFSTDAAEDAGLGRLLYQAVLRPGIMSILPPRAGIQKEWMTSGLSR